MERSASCSRDGRFRYDLGRRWSAGPVLTWVMLNPSTADAREDDPTLRRCIAFSRAWGFGGLRVVNLFAYRAADPRALLNAPNLTGPRGTRVLRTALREAHTVVAAWGNVHLRFATHAEAVRALLPEGTRCLGLTGRGEPRHPLYVPGGTMADTLSVFRTAPTMAA